MAQPESKLSRAIMKALRARGAFCFKVWGNEQMMNGLPDIICCYRGFFIAFETKTPEGKNPTPRQAYVHKRIRRDGAQGIVVVPRSVADALNVLDRIDTAGDIVQGVTDAVRAARKRHSKAARSRRHSE